MAADPIHVEADDDVPAIIERIRRSPAEDVHLVVPARARFGTSRFNFQLLKQYSTRLGKRVAIWSPDPAVQRMAEESGFGAFQPEPQAQNGYQPRPAAQAPPPVRPSRPTPPRPAPPPPSGARGLLDRVGANSFLSSVAAAAQGQAGASRPGGPGQPAQPDASSRIRIGAPRRLPDTLTRYQPARYVLYGGAALLLVAGLLAVLLYVPSARITLVAQAQPFSTPVDVQAAPGSGPVRVRIQTSSKSETQSGTASGQKVTPGQLAAGQFTYINSCPTALAIPNGQRLHSTGGVVFAQIGDVTINPGQQQAVDIKAVSSGQAGNVGAGQITGIDPNSYPCLTGANAAPTAGGSDDQKQTVIQNSDIESVKAALEQQVRQEIITDLSNAAQKDKGETFVTTPIFGNEKFTTTHNVDDPSPSFTATLSLTAEGDYYVADDLRQVVTKLLTAKVPRGEQLTTNPINTTTLISAASPGGHLDFTGNVSGYIAPQIDIEKVKGQLAGKSTTSAHDVLSSLPIQNSTISLSPPLPFMPLSASRISVDYGVQALPSAKSTT